MRPRKKRAMDTTDKMETSASANDMTIATAIIIAFGLLSGVALIVIVILLLVKFRGMLCRRCCPSSYGLNNKQAVDLPAGESGNNCHTVEAKGTDARTSEVILAEVRTINELKGSCREDNNNQYENGTGVLNQSDNLHLLTKDIIQEQPTADIERCRDNEHADIEEPQFSSLSDLTEMIQDIISSHMRQTSDGIINSSDGSLLPMTPESNNALAVIEIHQTDAQSQHDDHDLDSNAHSNADRCQALESDTLCKLPSLIPMDTEDMANHSADSKDAGSKIEMETVTSGNSTASPVIQETDPKSQSGISFPEMTTVYDEGLDYDSFVSSLQLGERHSMLITENQSFNNSDTDGEDVTPPIQPSSDVDIFSIVISTPCKNKADEMNADRESDDSANECAPKKKHLNGERLVDQNSVLLLTAQEVQKIGGSESSSSPCNQKTDTDVDDDNRNDICPHSRTATSQNQQQ
ncbi:hypothetical protein LSH36_759g01002 [Paralvinella palmiformis]|uniref:Uncharacterized protein n=1 Tax=Paralvinella palmiformis TaxID=53620 RepID=A0AAD9J170_9ANNE|nr:hypothetical protein LSH36_759g01002 [Paralvinella palmiformis]